MKYISVYEIAKKLGTSHTTIYKKIKRNEIYKELEPFIKVVNGSTCITIEGIEILKRYIKIEPSTEKNEQNKDKSRDTTKTEELLINI